MHLASARAALPLLAGPLLLAGCFRVSTLAERRPEPRARVVVRLTESGTRQLAGAIGPDVGALDGRVDAVRGDTLDLLVGRVHLLRGGTAFREGAFASIPLETVATVQVRTLDRPRSALLAGAVGAGGYLLGRWAWRGLFPEESEPHR